MITSFSLPTNSKSNKNREGKYLIAISESPDSLSKNWLPFPIWLTHQKILQLPSACNYRNPFVLSPFLARGWSSRLWDKNRWGFYLHCNGKPGWHCTKMKFSIKDFFSKCDQIRRKLRIWSHLRKKSLMENFIFCAVWKFILMLKVVHVSNSPWTSLYEGDKET